MTIANAREWKNKSKNASVLVFLQVLVPYIKKNTKGNSPDLHRRRGKEPTALLRRLLAGETTWSQVGVAIGAPPLSMMARVMFAFSNWLEATGPSMDKTLTARHLVIFLEVPSRCRQMAPPLQLEPV